MSQALGYAAREYTHLHAGATLMARSITEQAARDALLDMLGEISPKDIKVISVTPETLLAKIKELNSLLITIQQTLEIADAELGGQLAQL